jgi:hypothetical protein
MFQAPAVHGKTQERPVKFRRRSTAANHDLAAAINRLDLDLEKPSRLFPRRRRDWIARVCDRALYRLGEQRHAMMSEV